MKTAVLCKDLTGDPVEKDVPGETEAGGSSIIRKLIPRRRKMRAALGSLSKRTVSFIVRNIEMQVISVY